MLKKIILACLLVCIASVLGVMNYFSKALQTPVSINESPVTFVVESGSSLKRVLNKFYSNGWIQYPRVHEYWLRHHQLTQIHRGEYEITSSQTTEEIISMMVAGKKILRSIQFIEGKTFRDNLRVLAGNPYLTKNINGETAQEVFTLATGEEHYYEGWMFPDTYLFDAGTTDLEVINLAYARMQDVLAEEWANKADSAEVKTPLEALTLASIIEKETGAAFERAMISGVFTRRLKKDMRLQTDPTVIYGVGSDFDGNLTRAHLRQDTPYNTYTRKGLPPTPIANTGREAIHAALHPADGTAVYFVAKGDGTHYFSTTLKEHNQAVRKYQRFGRRSDYQSSPAEASE